MLVIDNYDSFEDIKTIFKDTNKYFSYINRDCDSTISKKNGYRIASVSITRDDAYMDMEDGKRLYTAVNPKFKADSKCVCIPIICRRDNQAEGEIIRHPEETYNIQDFKVFIGDGYINIFTPLMEKIENNYDICMVIITDNMYRSRKNALDYLLSTTT